MKKSNRIYFVLVAIFATSLAAMVDYELSVEEQWQREIDRGPKPEDKTLLQGKYIIFNEGVLGREIADIMGNYFTNNKKAVEKEMGGTAFTLSPSCELSIPENMKILGNKVKEIAYVQRKPITIFGHSKGAAEAYLLLLHKPELLLNGTIEHVLLVQAAIFGSPLADESGGFLFGLINSFLDCNMDTLTTTRTKEYVEEAYKKFHAKLAIEAEKRSVSKQDLIQKISDRIFWVPTVLGKSSPSFGTSLILFGLQNKLDDAKYEHDALLPLSSQIDTRLGRVLGVPHNKEWQRKILRNVDHIGLTVSEVSDVSDYAQRAFTRMAFRIMHEKDRENAAEF